MKRIIGIGLFLLVMPITSTFAQSLEEQARRNCVFLSGSLSTLEAVIGREDVCRITIQIARERCRVDIRKEVEDSICAYASRKNPL